MENSNAVMTSTDTECSGVAAMELDIDAPLSRQGSQKRRAPDALVDNSADAMLADSSTTESMNPVDDDAPATKKQATVSVQSPSVPDCDLKVLSPLTRDCSASMDAAQTSVSSLPMQATATVARVHETAFRLEPNEEYILGIDEAGRGPVLGAMVYGVCYCPKNRADQLAKMGFADSKALTAAQREELFAKIKASSLLGWAVDVISPIDLSSKMLRRNKYNLNAISHDSAIALAQNVIAQGVRVTEIYVDTVGDSKRYQEKLSALFPGVAVTVEKKADSTFPIVSAASICAKVTRDQELENWSFSEGSQFAVSRELGSGYPGDAVTKAWLTKNIDKVFGFPSIVRFSWSTCSNALKDKAVPIVWGDEEPEELEKLQHTFKSSASTVEITPSKRQSYFKLRSLGLVTNFQRPL